MKQIINKNNITKKELKKILQEKFEKLIDDAETDGVIVVTKNGVMLAGATPEILTRYASLTKKLKEVADQELIKLNFDMAFMNIDELNKLKESKRKELLKKIENILKK